MFKTSRRTGWLVAIAFLCVQAGCGPRAEVAKKKLLDKIDDFLGKMDVQRAEVEESMTGLQKGIAGIRKAKVQTQVKIEQVEAKTQPYQDKIKQYDQSLVTLRDALRSGQPAEFAGKTYSQTDLNAMADKIIKARKEATQRIDGFRTAKDNLEKLVADLEAKQRTFEDHYERLKAQVAKIDAEIVAAKAMKEASAAMGDGDATLADNLAKLEDKIAALSGEVRTNLMTESAKWNESAVTKQVNEVDAFIAATQSSGSTVDEIDRILGQRK